MGHRIRWQFIGSVWDCQRTISSDLLDWFQPVTSVDVARILGHCKPTISELSPCLAWLLKAAEWGYCGLGCEPYKCPVDPSCVKETIIRPILKCSNLVMENLNNFRHPANIHFMSKWWKKSSRCSWREKIAWINFSPGSGHTMVLGQHWLHGNMTSSLMGEDWHCWCSLISQRPLIPWTALSSWTDCWVWELECWRLADSDSFSIAMSKSSAWGGNVNPLDPKM